MSGLFPQMTLMNADDLHNLPSSASFGNNQNRTEIYFIMPLEKKLRMQCVALTGQAGLKVT
jgi:hypothetical protein